MWSPSKNEEYFVPLELFIFTLLQKLICLLMCTLT